MAVVNQVRGTEIQIAYIVSALAPNINEALSIALTNSKSANEACIMWGVAGWFKAEICRLKVINYGKNK